MQLIQLAHDDRSLLGGHFFLQSIQSSGAAWIQTKARRSFELDGFDLISPQPGELAEGPEKSGVETVGGVIARKSVGQAFFQNVDAGFVRAQRADVVHLGESVGGGFCQSRRLHHDPCRSGFQGQDGQIADPIQPCRKRAGHVASINAQANGVPGAVDQRIQQVAHHHGRQAGASGAGPG
ncbi:MAG TPA: hypothetical protein VH374_01455 [Polyangia bacterium]|nr:hypothetical protein [Polyangia bacterium]